MRPLTVFVLVEFVVLVLMAVVWLGGTTRAASLATESAAAVAPDPDSGTTRVTATANAQTPTPRREALSPVPDVAVGDPVGILLSGCVRSREGAPVQGASVTLRRDEVGRSGDSGDLGMFAIAGLQPGEWRLSCRAEQFVPHEVPIVLDQRAFQQVDIELQPTFTVRVKLQGADGKSILDALQRETMFGMPSVVATEAPLAGDLPPTSQSRITRFGVGEWRSFDSLGGSAEPKLLEQGYCGELRLNRPPPVFASLLLRSTLLQAQRIEPGQRELVFTIEAKDVLAKHGRVTLRLLDGVTGNPIADAAVGVRTAQGGGSHAKSGADGRVVCENVLPGLGMLELMQGPEREGLSRYVRVAPGASVDLGDITLGTMEKIVGVVVDADGKPANGASLQWTELDARTFPQPLIEYRSASVEADGTFQLWGCGRHRYVVFARTQDRRFGFTTVDARAGAPTGVSITVAKPTTVTLRTEADGTVGYTVTALAADRSPVAVATLGTEYRPTTIALPTGAYTIEIHDMMTDRLVRSFALQVGGEPLTIDVP